MADTTTTYFQDNWCVYPVSGAYTRFQRILLYVAIIIAFTFRFQQWLSGGALSYVVIYTLTAVVHALPMAFQKHLGVDADYIALLSILRTSLLCSVMAKAYSPRFFRMDFNLLYLAWMILTILGVSVLDYNQFKFINSTADYVIESMCIYASSCPDPYATVQPSVLFRAPGDSTTGVLLSSWISDTYVPPENETFIALNPSSKGYTVGYKALLDIRLLLLTIFVMWPLFIIGQRNQERPPRKARNDVFKRMLHRRIRKVSANLPDSRFWFYLSYSAFQVWRVIIYVVPELFILFCPVGIIISKKHERWLEQKTVLKRSHSARRLRLAKIVALVWYLLGLCAYAVWPVTLLYNIIILEQDWLKKLPESEGMTAVGQWGPWVGFALTGIIVSMWRLIYGAGRADPKSEASSFQQDRDSVFRYKLQPGDGWFWRHQPTASLCREWRDLSHWYRDPLSFLEDGSGITSGVSNTLSPGMTNEADSLPLLERRGRHSRQTW